MPMLRIFFVFRNLSFAKRCSDDSGFTLPELISVIVITGILASVAVPKFIDMRASAELAQCQSNRSAISYAVAMFYVDTLLRDPNAVDWLENASMSDVSASWFATGSIPQCPTGGIFTLNMGNPVCSIHGV